MREEWESDTLPGKRAGDDYFEESATAAGRAKRELATIPPRVWIMATIALLMVVAVCGLWALYLLREGGGLAGPSPTPIVWTPTQGPSPTPAATETVAATPTLSPNVGVGSRVMIADTEGQGLSLRAGPGADYLRMDIALQGEVFFVSDGPVRSGGATWWKLRDPADAERSWWAVGNYLQPVDQP
ncbi:MAG: hypothetical protein E3J64_09410 [Anaerolineales bacterium]|nr:MAG: hypothetical protein E3J64_09410 [Anaerolineales bacterium]